MKIGYLPDSFGQSSQMPMIYNQFGITRSVFWRGTSERMGTTKTEFFQESDDGSKVLCQLLPLGYAIGKYLPEEKEALHERMKKYMPVLERGATGDHILVPNGHDQMPIQKNIFQVMETMKELYPEKNFFLSDYESIFEELEKTDGYATLKGEFLDGKYMRVHRSIYSSRADIKSMNTRIESKITNILEPVASIAHSLGFDYYNHAIEDIWKDILKNHAHDSMGCCCSDEVHKEIIARYQDAETKADQLIRFYLRKITDATEDTGTTERLGVFNTLPYPRKQVIHAQVTTRMKGFCILDPEGKNISYTVLDKQELDPGLIDRQIVHYGNYDPFTVYTIEFEDEIPSLGYKAYALKEGASVPVLALPASTMENTYYHISFNDNGTLDILDKETGEIYRQVLRLEDGGDEGDGYDYSPPIHDAILYSDDVQAQTKITAYGLSSQATVCFRMDLPLNLQERKENKRNGYMDIRCTIRLEKNSKRIAIDYTVDNHAKDHRVRVMIPQNAASCFTLADNPFGEIKRDLKDAAMETWEKERWSERPDAIYPMLTYVKMDQGKLGFLTGSVREYEAIKDDLLAITLFRCTGLLGKDSLVRRPGCPSGIGMETPEQQMQGIQTYSFALCMADLDMPVQAKEYLTPIMTYNKPAFNAMKMNPSKQTVPSSYSLFRLESKGFILTAFKKAEERQGYILRGYNPREEECVLRLNAKAYETRLDESVLFFRKRNPVWKESCRIGIYRARNGMTS